MSSFDGLAHLWSAQLAAAIAVAVVMLLRPWCRRWLGAERAFLLWLLPLLALVASQWPHEMGVELFVLPEPVRRVTAVPASQAVPMAAGVHGQFVILVWMFGVVAILAMACRAQWTYERQLQGASLYGARGRWRVVRAVSPSTGPAMVGAWRPVIVLPSDFEQRYSAEERALVLAHEVAHAERRDGLWALFALLFSAFCWPGALALWAHRAFRHDQELACDARVLRRVACRRRSYALAMLKTPASRLALASGCSWSSRHPLTERIAMLNSNLPSPLVRRAGLVAMSAVAIGVTGFVYAATAPAQQSKLSTAQTVAEYQLDMSVEVSSEHEGSRHARRANLALCMKPGEQGSVSVHDWSLDAIVTPGEADQVRMTLNLKDGAGADLASSHLQGKLDAAVHESGAARDGAHQYVIDVTPRVGCPARDRAKTARTG